MNWPLVAPSAWCEEGEEQMIKRGTLEEDKRGKAEANLPVVKISPNRRRRRRRRRGRRRRIFCEY
jgi:hypothetical protein